MNVIARLVAATGAVILWAYARACRERTATQRRLARANLLRTISSRPTRCADCGREDGGCDRVITVDITPAEAERLSAIHNRRLLDDLEQTVEDLPFADLTPEQRGSFTMPATGAPQSGATR